MVRFPKYYIFLGLILIYGSLSIACMGFPLDNSELQRSDNIIFAGYYPEPDVPITIEFYSAIDNQWKEWSFPPHTRTGTVPFVDETGKSWYPWRYDMTSLSIFAWHYHEEARRSYMYFRAKVHGTDTYLNTMDLEKVVSGCAGNNFDKGLFEVIKACKSDRSPEALVWSPVCGEEGEPCCFSDPICIKPGGTGRDQRQCADYGPDRPKLCEDCGYEGKKCCKNINGLVPFLCHTTGPALYCDTTQLISDDDPGICRAVESSPPNLHQ